MSINVKKIKNIACMLDNVQKMMDVVNSGGSYTLKTTGDTVIEFSIIPKDSSAQAAFSHILANSLLEYTKELEIALRREVKAIQA
jgi:hypothetical protein